MDHYDWQPWIFAGIGLVLGALIGFMGGRRGERVLTWLALGVVVAAMFRASLPGEWPHLWDAGVATVLAIVGAWLGWSSGAAGWKGGLQAVVGVVVAVALLEAGARVLLPTPPMSRFPIFQGIVHGCAEPPDDLVDDPRPWVVHLGDSMPACTDQFGYDTLVDFLDDPDLPVRHVCLAREGRGPDVELSCLERFVEDHPDRVCAVVWHLFPANDLTDMGLPSSGSTEPAFVLDAEGRAVPPPRREDVGPWHRAIVRSVAPFLLYEASRHSRAAAYARLVLAWARQAMLGRVPDPLDPRGTEVQHTLLDAVLTRAVDTAAERGFRWFVYMVPNRLAFGDGLAPERHREAEQLMADAVERAGLPRIGDGAWLVEADATLDPQVLYEGGDDFYPHGGDPHFRAEGHRRWADALRPHLVDLCPVEGPSGDEVTP